MKGKKKNQWQENINSFFAPSCQHEYVFEGWTNEGGQKRYCMKCKARVTSFPASPLYDHRLPRITNSVPAE